MGRGKASWRGELGIGVKGRKRTLWARRREQYVGGFHLCRGFIFKVKYEHQGEGEVGKNGGRCPYPLEPLKENRKSLKWENKGGIKESQLESSGRSNEGEENLGRAKLALIFSAWWGKGGGGGGGGGEEQFKR